MTTEERCRICPCLLARKSHHLSSKVTSDSPGSLIISHGILSSFFHDMPERFPHLSSHIPRLTRVRFTFLYAVVLMSAGLAPLFSADHAWLVHGLSRLGRGIDDKDEKPLDHALVRFVAQQFVAFLHLFSAALISVVEEK